MLKVLFNQDGSIGGFQFPNFVTQGSHGTESTKIAVAVDGDFDIYDSNLLIVAKFRLPNGEYNEIAFPVNPEPETFELVGRTYNCRSIYLTELQTVFAGALFISIAITNITTQETLYTYQCKIMIDPSTYSTDGKFEVVSYDNLAQQVLWLYQNALNQDNAYSKTQADAKFVIKVTDSNVVYGTNLSGEEYHIAYSFNVTPQALVQRDNNGQVLVPETPTANNNAASKKYVDDAKQEIKDIAESRIKNWILSYDETIATAKAACNEIPTVKFLVLNSSGEFEDKRAELLNGDYDNLNIVNNVFNTMNDNFNLMSARYIIFKNLGISVTSRNPNLEYYLVYVNYFNLVSGPVGSNVYVTNLEVPDRWISSTIGSPANVFVFSALESKTNLSNYPTKTEMETAISEAQLGGTASFDQLPTENSQNAVTSGGVYQALYNNPLNRLYMHNKVHYSLTVSSDRDDILNINITNSYISKRASISNLQELGNSIAAYVASETGTAPFIHQNCEVDATGTYTINRGTSAQTSYTIKKFGLEAGLNPYIIDSNDQKISLSNHNTSACEITDYIAIIL